MKATNDDLFTGKGVQHGLCRTNTGNIQSVWFEFTQNCDLRCQYCFVGENANLCKTSHMDKQNVVLMLDECKKLGVDSIGIPGTGEPFYGGNTEFTMWFLRECEQRGMYVTLFTTGAHITPELAAELYKLPVELMLKCNSLDPVRQDKFVSGKEEIIVGYGELRNKAIEILMAAGFNDRDAARIYGRESRMALVTSIMTDDQESGLDNLDEIADIYRYCRKNNIIADIDTILKRGRALECGLKSGDQRVMPVLAELRQIAVEEFGDSEVSLSSTYVETVCDRFHHHLYVDYKGRIRPCIGAMDVDLGTFPETSLEEAWNSEERCIIRERKFAGACVECANFQEEKCHSCLGRRTPTEGEKKLTNESLLRDGAVWTTGCPMFRR